jgi:hypothetical protein
MYSKDTKQEIQAGLTQGEQQFVQVKDVGIFVLRWFLDAHVAFHGGVDQLCVCA